MGAYLSNTAIFKDRKYAGKLLAEKLTAYRNQVNVVVLALPRGGVPVAYEVALRLNASLDVFTVRKLGVPGHEELALGAIASGGVRVLNDEIVDDLHISPKIIDEISWREIQELERRERAYRGNRRPLEVREHVAILIDDGLATGASMRAAVAGLRLRNPRRLVVAVPVAGREARNLLAPIVDEIICVAMPEPFYGVGQWYQNFSQTTDEEIHQLLEQAAWKIQP